MCSVWQCWRVHDCVHLGICVLVHVFCFICNDISVHVCACMVVLCVHSCMLFNVCWSVFVTVGVFLLVCVCKVCSSLLSVCTWVLEFALILVHASLCILVDAYVVQASCVISACEYVSVGAYILVIICMCMCVNINMLYLFIWHFWNTYHFPNLKIILAL